MRADGQEVHPMIANRIPRPAELFAVICGIDEYEGDYPTLQSAVSDAQKLTDVLGKCWGERAHIDLQTWPAATIPNANACAARTASAATILQAIRNMESLTEEGDSLLVYCKCHSDHEAGEACLVTAGTGSSQRFLPLKDVLATGSVATARHRLLILDWPCPPREGDREVFECLRASAAVWTVWVSCGPGEFALDIMLDTNGRAGQCGLFACSLIDAIDRNATSRTHGAELSRVVADTARGIAVHLSQGAQGCISTSPHPQHRKTFAQNPVLAAGTFAADGRFGYLVAPPMRMRVPGTENSSSASSRPTLSFLGGLKSFTFGPWPIEIPYGGAMRLILSFNYGLIMFFAAQAFQAQPLTPTSLARAVAIGLLSFLICQVFMASLVAANMARLERGALFPPSGLLLWGTTVLIMTGFTHFLPNPVLAICIQLADALAVICVQAVYIYSLTTLIAFAEYVGRGERKNLRFLIQLVNHLELGQEEVFGHEGNCAASPRPTRLPFAVTDQNSLFRQKSTRPLWYFLFWLAVVVTGIVEQLALEKMAPAHGWGWLLFRNGWLWIYGLLYCIWYVYAYYAARNVIRQR